MTSSQTPRCRLHRVLFMSLLLGTSTVSICGFAQQKTTDSLRAPNMSARIATLPPEIGSREVYFVNLKDKDVVRSPFRVVFGATGVGIAPAGVVKPDTGHHHLLIDTGLPLDLKKPIPFAENKYVHFGGGQTEAVLELGPGQHTLQLLFADHDHKPVFKTKSGSEIVLYSRKLTITVEGSPQKR